MLLALGEGSGAGRCPEGVPCTREGLKDDPISVDVSIVGHVTSREAMVGVWFVQKSVSFHINWMMRSKEKVSCVNCFHIKRLLCKKVSKECKLLF